MPAFSFSLVPIFFIIGCIMRVFFWFVVLWMGFDCIRRYMKDKTFESFCFMKYIIFYYTISFVSLLKINMRPVVT